MGNFRTKKNPVGLKSDNNFIANTRHLMRIITYLNEVEYATASQMRKATGIDRQRIKDALLFLINFAIIERTSNTESKKYWLHPSFRIKI